MPIRYSNEVRDAMMEAMETTMGATPILRIYSGGIPATLTSPRTGTVLAELNLPADIFANSVNGQKTLQGTWSDLETNGAGTAGYYSIFKADGTTICEDGTVSAEGGSGDLQVDNTEFAVGQTFTITTFTRTAGNAPG